MHFDADRIADPAFFAEHRMAPHSDHRWFASQAEALSGESSFEQCLNGLWKFHYAKNLDARIHGFEAPEVDTAAWDDIPVPAHIQLQGYDRPQYVNVQYPWDGLEDIAPGEIPRHDNPVASYVRHFTLDTPLGDGERLSVSFKGAESAVAVWLNGTYVGYGCDSFTPSEFDLTGALVDGENKLAAQVFKFSGASWLEDQDFFRFSGLFRDVVLHRRPATHLQDLRVTTDVADDLATAAIELRCELHGEGSLRARVEGIGEFTGTDPLRLELTEPRLWSGEDPHLYTVEIEVLDADGALVEVVHQRVGVRRFGIEDGVLKLNGRRIVFNGVNRHEFGPRGRVMTPEETRRDLELLRRNNVNAIRTSHYPNNSFFYDLCDEYGLYVIDEMNLETHGVWDEILRGRRTIDQSVPGDDPRWAGALLDRAANMLERDKNHPSIVMWSCGNESLGGTNLLAVADFFRERDDRPVHYEGVAADPRHPGTTDVRSEMYTTAAQVEQHLKEHRDKPFILCEYAHAMGNSFGAVDRYVGLAYREELYQGGFIWDFADQALLTRDRQGREFFGYGGDFGDRPHDGDFSGNGICYADHTPKPFMQEVRKLYQGLRIDVTREGVEVENRYLFTNAKEFAGTITLRREGRTLREEDLSVDVAPGDTSSSALPFDLPSEPGEYTVDVSFRLARPVVWAPEGHEVAWGQGVVQVGDTPAARSTRAPQFIDGTSNFGVRGRHFTALFSKTLGGMVSYVVGGREFLESIPKPTFWHAPTSNGRGWGMPFQDGQWLLASRYARVKGEPTATQRDDAVEVVYTYELPTTPTSECDVAYVVDGDGRVEVAMTVRPGDGLPDMPEFGLSLTTDPDLHHLRWYGEGPEECYVDRRAGARLDVHCADVRELLPSYLRPQESGSRTGVRWADLTDDQGRGLRFEAREPMEFSALPWSPFEVENALHPSELPPRQRTVVRPALMRRGVGGDDSWQAEPHPQYRLPADGASFAFSFRGITGG